jgi:hypothetical protein
VAVGESALIVSQRPALVFILLSLSAFLTALSLSGVFFISSSSITASQHSLGHSSVRTQISKL